jgi:hypothetical protein
MPRRSNFFWGKMIDSCPIQENVNIVARVEWHLWRGKTLSDGWFSLQILRWR